MEEVCLVTEETSSDTDELIRLLKEDTDVPNLVHGNALELLPEWFEEEKFKRGQKFFKDNFFSLFVSKLCGLIVILSIPRVLRILIMTQKSSEPKTAFKRYVSTLSHMLLWYNGDVTDKNSWAYKSLTEVHSKHLAADRRGKLNKKGSLSQSSLAITQFGFMGFGILKPEKLGIKINDEKDLEGFIHFWRVIGYLVGVNDKYNICNGTIQETKEICQRILDEILCPHIKNSSQDFIEMTTALIEGLWAMVPALDVQGFMAFTYNLSGLEVPPFTNWWSETIYNIQVYVHSVLLNSKLFGFFFRAFCNFEMKLSVFLAQKFPYLAFYSFGIPLKYKSED